MKVHQTKEIFSIVEFDEDKEKINQKYLKSLWVTM